MFLTGILSWAENHLLPCLFKSVTGMDCPGCGLQRSIIYLLDGELQKSLHMYWATMPILLMFIFLVFHLVFKFTYGTRLLVVLYAFNGLLIFCHYIYKLTAINV